MHFNLILLRNGGIRLSQKQLKQLPRLVSVTMVLEAGYHQLVARCCYGGSEIGRLWSPTVAQVGDSFMVLQGYESYADAGVVQEWRLTPHGVGSTQGERHEADCSTSSASGRSAFLERNSR